MHQNLNGCKFTFQINSKVQSPDTSLQMKVCTDAPTDSSSHQIASLLDQQVPEKPTTKSVELLFA